MIARILGQWKSHFAEPLVKRNFAIPPIDLDRASRTALRRQIYQQVAQAIRTGQIPDGARLPSSRWLAKPLGLYSVAVYYDLAVTVYSSQ